jgi:hypothetical protein
MDNKKLRSGTANQDTFTKSAKFTHEELVDTEKPKKRKHMKSNSNVEEFAFNDGKLLEEKLCNFVNNYDGKAYL